MGEKFKERQSESFFQNRVSGGMEHVNYEGDDMDVCVDSSNEENIISGGKHGESSAGTSYGTNMPLQTMPSEMEPGIEQQQTEGPTQIYTPSPLVFIPLDVYHRYVENTNYLHYILTHMQFPYYAPTFLPYTNTSHSSTVPQNFSTPFYNSWPNAATYPYSYSSFYNNVFDWADTTTSSASSQPFAYSTAAAIAPATDQTTSNYYFHPQSFLQQAWLPTAITPRHFVPQAVISPPEHLGSSPHYSKPPARSMRLSRGSDWRQRSPTAPFQQVSSPSASSRPGSLWRPLPFSSSSEFPSRSSNNSSGYKLLSGEPLDSRTVSGSTTWVPPSGNEDENTSATVGKI